MKAVIKLKKLKKLYNSDININRYLRKNTNLNEADIIRLSYDLQTNSYIKIFNERKKISVLKGVIDEINKTNSSTILDFGCGDLTSFYTIAKKIKKNKKKIYYACDISLSRIFPGVNFLKKKGMSLKNKFFFVNQNHKLPFADSSIDIIVTCHSIEPNKTKASLIIKELYRVAKKKLILLEPDNNLVKNKYPKKLKRKILLRMRKNNYVKNIGNILKKFKFNFKVVENEFNATKLNPASIFIVKKGKTEKNNKSKFCNPSELTNKDVLKKEDHFYFSETSGEIFPIINNIVLFKKNNIYIESQ